MLSLLMLTLKVSSPMAQEILVFQSALSSSSDADAPTPPMVSAASVPLKREMPSSYAVLEGTLRLSFPASFPAASK